MTKVENFIPECGSCKKPQRLFKNTQTASTCWMCINPDCSLGLNPEGFKQTWYLVPSCTIEKGRRNYDSTKV